MEQLPKEMNDYLIEIFNFDEDDLLKLKKKGMI